jgi:thiamine transport system substrate-binding protein
MKKHYLVLILTVLLFPALLFGQGSRDKSTTESESLTVYAYDSFVSEWGPGPTIVKEFEQKEGIKVNLVSAGNGGELLGRLMLEKERPKADIVIGLSNELLHDALKSDLFRTYNSPKLAEIPNFLHFDASYKLLPFNWGSFAFVYDSRKISTPPTSFEDLLDSQYRKSLILIDPRTSNVGMGLLEWTIAVYGDDYLKWWEQIKPNVLTIADGWSSGYGLFTEGEAPIVISYTTSPVYHILFEDSDVFKAVAFEEGNLAVVEGAAILKSSSKVEQAQKFIDFLLSDAQQEIAIANVMYPANASVELPEAFDQLVEVKKSLFLESDIIASKRDTWLNEWTEVMSK